MSFGHCLKNNINIILQPSDEQFKIRELNLSNLRQDKNVPLLVEGPECLTPICFKILFKSLEISHKNKSYLFSWVFVLLKSHYKAAHCTDYPVLVLVILCLPHSLKTYQIPCTLPIRQHCPTVTTVALAISTLLYLQH